MRRVLAILLFTIYSCSTASYNYKSRWISSEENNAPATFFNKENQLTIDCSNNLQNIKIQIITNSEKTIKKIKTQGLSLWINAGKTAHKHFGVHYPLPFTKKAADTIVLEGYSGDEAIAFSLSELTDIKALVQTDSSLFHYTLYLPFAAFDAAPSENYISIGVESFLKENAEPQSGLTAREAIEQRLDVYKARPTDAPNSKEITPVFQTFQLAKMPNKNP